MAGNNAINAITSSSGWTSFTTTITASSNPSKGTVVTDLSYYLQLGKMLFVKWNFQSTSGSVGSGVYSFSIPAGFTIDTAKTGTANQTVSNFMPNIGIGWASNSTTNGEVLPLFVATSTTYKAFSPGNAQFISNTIYGLGQTAGNSFCFDLQIPIL